MTVNGEGTARRDSWLAFQPRNGLGQLPDGHSAGASRTCVEFSMFPEWLQQSEVRRVLVRTTSGRPSARVQKGRQAVAGANQLRSGSTSWEQSKGRCHEMATRT